MWRPEVTEMSVCEQAMPDPEKDLIKAAKTAELVKQTITENIKQSQLR